MVYDAISAWIRGLKHALTGMEQSRQLTTLTFVEIEPRKVIEINQAILREQHRLKAENRLIIEYAGFDEEKIDQLEQQERDRQVLSVMKPPSSDTSSDDPSITRITVSMEGNTYQFGAMTDRASLPVREISLDPRLVMQANEELAAEGDEARQLESGQFMERLLLPQDLRRELYTDEPLVIILDATTARIHWELVAQADLANPRPDQVDNEDRHLYFLGTSRGITRQLRTPLAPLPELEPPPHRIMRVLVVADPAADARLPGAEEEGIAVADLMERFNTVHGACKNRIEVVRLLGPREATRTAVLRELMMRFYDVLHFAGHAVYDENDPASSGWIFSHGERLTAREFTRIDRIPKFVFSNACESGVTPERPSERTVDLAPSLAEAFFERGVANFVCTAWPVDDAAAREFALALYAGLLGLVQVPEADQQRGYQAGRPLAMYQAMRNARLAIARPPYDIRTWGAYQHYGNPFLRFFDPRTMGVA
jgi:hypothetical protein